VETNLPRGILCIKVEYKNTPDNIIKRKVIRSLIDLNGLEIRFFFIRDALYFA
jgi:hypothetical protein